MACSIRSGGWRGLGSYRHPTLHPIGNADRAPGNDLVLIDESELLPALYEAVFECKQHPANRSVSPYWPACNAVLSSTRSTAFIRKTRTVARPVGVSPTIVTSCRAKCSGQISRLG